MKSEHIIWIVAFLIYIVAAIVKKGRAASKTGTPKVATKPPEWREKLNKFLAQIQQQAAGEETSFENLELAREEAPVDTIEPVIEKSPLPKRKPAVPKRKPALVKADVKIPEPAVSAKEIRPKDLAFGIQDLRKAVIWSEILAPPLALREDK